MSWLYSRALVEEYSLGKNLDGEPFAQLNVMPTPQLFWRNDKMMKFSKLSQFGLTLKRLTENHGEELLTLYLAGFHARTLAQQGKVKALPATAPAYGKKCTVLFARYDHDSSLWKTPQCSLLEDSELYSETWPKQGMTVNGLAYPLPKLARRISVKESGLLATPTATANQLAPSMMKHRGCRNWWPTPTAHMAKETNAPSEANRNQPSMSSIVGGKLNPPWVEWLMGWPIGWTDLKPLVTDKSHSAPPKHGDY